MKSFVLLTLSALSIGTYSKQLTVSLVNYDAMYNNECINTIASEISADVCSLPPVTGPCRAGFTRYFYNATSEQCETFLYGGCKGNANNFYTQALCQDVCSSIQDICSLPSETGRCKAAIPRYFYNDSKECEQFTYGGCGGNANNFVSKTECEYSCIDDESDVIPQINEFCNCLGKMVNNDKSYDKSEIDFVGCIDTIKSNEELKNSLQEKTQNYLHEYNIETDEWENAALFEKMEDNICSLPSKTGPCRASKPRYYYNSETSDCELFIYGGCKGNRNRFKTEEQCQYVCGNYGDTKDENDNICSLPAVTGPCRAKIPAFYYNSPTKHCESFYYGGCQGNDNRFGTMGECETECGSGIDICSLSKEVGPCRAKIPAFYYNSETKQCESFYYGGCRGNDNRFSSKDKCEAECGSDFDVCSLPKEVGICRAKIPAFYYNSETKQCESFYYGGCHGNENRFSSLAQCQDKCDNVALYTTTTTGNDESAVILDSTPDQATFANGAFYVTLIGFSILLFICIWFMKRCNLKGIQYGEYETVNNKNNAKSSYQSDALF